MHVSLDLIESEINDLIVTCYKRSFKSKDPLQALRDSFQKLNSIRAGIAADYPAFISENDIDPIIEILNAAINNKADRKEAEWLFDHHSDIYKFKAEALLDSISKLSTSIKAEQELLVSKRKALLSKEFSNPGIKNNLAG